VAARCKSPLLFDLLEFSSDKKMYVHWRWRWMLKAQPSWSSGRSPALSEVSKRICKRCRQKNSESHNCNRERIVSGYFEHRVLTAPTRERSSCCRNSRQALRVAVVTVYLGENTTQSFEVIDALDLRRHPVMTCDRAALVLRRFLVGFQPFITPTSSDKRPAQAEVHSIATGAAR
jgi:hypothetical protein